MELYAEAEDESWGLTMDIETVNSVGRCLFSVVSVDKTRIVLLFCVSDDAV